MISLLRGLMANDGNTDRPLFSLILLGIFDFVCVLNAGELYKDRQVVAGTWWLIAGVAFSVMGYYWSKIKQKIADRLVAIGRWLQDKDEPVHENTADPKLVIHRSVHDVVDDCSMGGDPAGPWKYGYSRGVGNGFNPFNVRQSDTFAGVDRWFCLESEHLGVMHNRTNHTVAGEPRTYTIPANMMHMHPGIGGYCAVIRWQCPEDGIYTIQGSWEGLDKQTNADAEVHIMRNSGDLWDTTLGGVPSVKTFLLSEPFESKDKLDFVVGQGVNWGSDSVGLKAAIRKV